MSTDPASRFRSQAALQSTPQPAPQPALQNTLVAGASASVLSTLVLALAGRRQTGSAYAPTNAVSHWLWGRPALAKNAPSWRHTAVGYVIHHGSAMLWSWLYASWQRQRQDSAALPLLGTAAAVSALASVVDFKVAPERLHPGFEHRLSTPSLVAVYAAFGLGLALPYLLRGRGRDTGQQPARIAYTEIR